MPKKNTSQEINKLIVTLSDNRGQPITLSYQGDQLNGFIQAIGLLSRSLDTSLSKDQENTPGERKKISRRFINQQSQNLLDEIVEIENLSKIDKMKLLIRSTYKYGWFSAKDIHSLYQEYLGEISASTVSTYLARLFSETILNRRGSKRDLEYMLNSHQLKKIPEYKFSKENNILHLKRL
jgi:predicted transcriptional regulator